MIRPRHALIAVTCAALAAPVAAPPVAAEGLRAQAASKSRAALFASQTRLLDTRLKDQYANSVRLKPGAKAEPDAIPRYAGKYSGPHLETARAAARKHGIPEDLFLRLVQQESGWNVGAVSVKGATGLAQLMPDTATLLGVDINDPAQNLEGGARYLAMMYKRFGNWRHALAAYNAGPEAVAKHGGIPPYAETTAYVRVIFGS